MSEVIVLFFLKLLTRDIKKSLKRLAISLQSLVMLLFSFIFYMICRIQTMYTLELLAMLIYYTIVLFLEASIICFVLFFQYLYSPHIPIAWNLSLIFLAYIISLLYQSGCLCFFHSLIYKSMFNKYIIKISYHSFTHTWSHFQIQLSQKVLLQV